MKKIFLAIFCLLLANLASAQVTDSTKVKKTTKTTTTTTTIITTVVTEPADSAKQAKKGKKIKEVTAKQELTSKRNIIKTNLTSFFIFTTHLSYERVINQKVTVQIGAYYTFFDNAGILNSNNNNNNGNNNGNNNYESDYELRGFGITPEIRLYPYGTAPTGFFVGLAPRFQAYTATYNDYANQGFGFTEVKTAALGLGIIFGQQWIIGDSICLDLFLGPSVNAILRREQIGNANTNYNTPYMRPIGLRIGFNVGFAF